MLSIDAKSLENVLISIAPSRYNSVRSLVLLITYVDGDLVSSSVGLDNIIDEIGVKSLTPGILFPLKNARSHQL